MSENTQLPSDSDLAPKSAAESKIERLTWFALVGILVIANTFGGWLSLHYGFTPLAAGVVLIVSGLHQYRRGWTVGYSTWIAGTLLLVTAGLSFISRPDLDLSLVVIVISAIIIALGVFTRET